MKKIIKLLTICLVVGGGVLLFAPQLAFAAACGSGTYDPATQQCCAGSAIAKGQTCTSGTNGLDLSSGASAANPNTTTKDLPAIFGTIVNVILYILGAVSVIMLIYGGVRYTTSGGNAANVKAAKDTIIYAIVGLVVAILAYAIVNFIITKIV